MVHSARKNSPYMSNGHCSKHFPKKFDETTSVDEEGYAVYRRRDNAKTVLKMVLNSITDLLCHIIVTYC